MTADTNPDLFDNDPVFQLKGGMVAMTQIELLRGGSDQFERQLAEKIEQAPNFFTDTPVVLGLDRLEQSPAADDIRLLLDICRRHGLQPVGLRGGEQWRSLASECATLLLPPGRGRERDSDSAPANSRSEPQPAAAPAPSPEAAPASAGKLVNQPIRSGQQVYAPAGDLVVHSAVSAGAEVLSDGHIHVYGPLRGRALAGVRGNAEARIFCQSLEAELISIAGQYKVAEDLRRDPLWKQPAQIWLDGDSLKITAL
ncbi:MAG: septum site-determining protein MinC [Halopseudomonas yangmingensis]|uniref:Probable septum site-determining protein MinC n=1 Tax=Halopseudomonas yangmingensis TaxID=1720063 RepID=A0A1I4NK07_9GAMM|nr:septum site-determining protein MinC [Halopseudomonas yangmingensis]SFM15854.1 septum site-determining protein MinC [Halopseudomonas yangmingensis]